MKSQGNKFVCHQNFDENLETDLQKINTVFSEAKFWCRRFFTLKNGDRFIKKAAPIF